MKNKKFRMKKSDLRNQLATFALIIIKVSTQAKTQISRTDKQFAVFQQNVEKWKTAYKSG